MTTETTTHEQEWDDRYNESERIWSGEPNPTLVKEVAGLKPGTALELGCGEGGDTVWLARRGWHVTATDISGVALGRTAEHAARAGVADRVVPERHDLAESFPAGSFDLVCAHFLHSYRDMPRERILRTAASAVAPGGVLLVVGHSGFPSWMEEPPADVSLPSAREVLASLELRPDAWEVLVTEEHRAPSTGPEGQRGFHANNTVKARRLA
ncbi:SAM-dependent methyltransferase [Streptomyces sp. NPDC012623]|uniref:SAM-dependent methyltransferase n=1 Tax=unclassified Streptomyces TaxID=2593676 RepID=UPI00369338C1